METNAITEGPEDKVLEYTTTIRSPNRVRRLYPFCSPRSSSLPLMEKSVMPLGEIAARSSPFPTNSRPLRLQTGGSQQSQVSVGFPTRRSAPCPLTRPFHTDVRCIYPARGATTLYIILPGPSPHHYASHWTDIAADAGLRSQEKLKRMTMVGGSTAAEKD